MRDKFLTALDAQDQATLDAVVPYLVDCDNLLPSSTCVLLGLGPRSTYGDGIKAVVERTRIANLK